MSQGDKSAPKLGSIPHTKHLNSSDRPWYGLGDGATISSGCKLWSEFNREIQLRELVHNQIGCFDPRHSQNKPDTDEMALAIRRILTLQKSNY